MATPASPPPATVEDALAEPKQTTALKAATPPGPQHAPASATRALPAPLDPITSSESAKTTTPDIGASWGSLTSRTHVHRFHTATPTAFIGRDSAHSNSLVLQDSDLYDEHAKLTLLPNPTMIAMTRVQVSSVCEGAEIKVFALDEPEPRTPRTATFGQKPVDLLVSNVPGKWKLSFVSDDKMCKDDVIFSYTPADFPDYAYERRLAGGNLNDGIYVVSKFSTTIGENHVTVRKSSALEKGNVVVKVQRRHVATMGMGEILVMKGVRELARAMKDPRSKTLAMILEDNLPETGEPPPTLFFSMEYQEGGPLSDHLSNNLLRLDMNARRLIGEMGDGLEFLNEHGIVHRDVKPGNMVLTSSDINTTHLLYIDFGLSQIGGTAVQGVHGTATYIPGEAFDFPQKLRDGSKDDLWALGGTIVEFLSGRIAKQPPQGKGKVLPRSLADLELATKSLHPGNRKLSASLFDLVAPFISINPEDRRWPEKGFRAHLFFTMELEVLESEEAGERSPLLSEAATPLELAETDLEELAPQDVPPPQDAENEVPTILETEAYENARVVVDVATNPNATAEHQNLPVSSHHTPPPTAQPAVETVQSPSPFEAVSPPNNTADETKRKVEEQEQEQERGPSKRARVASPEPTPAARRSQGDGSQRPSGPAIPSPRALRRKNRNAKH